MKKNGSTLIAIFLLAWGQTNYAALHLELTQGVSSSIPIAIVPFKGQEANSTTQQNVSETIQNDLRNSGQFKVLPPDSFQQLPSSPAELNMATWKNSGASDVVVGNITQSGGKYKITYSLVDLVQNGTASKNIISSNSFEVSSNQLRRAAHKISDEIYQKLTGKRGVFSTRIAYVLEETHGSNNSKYLLEVADADGFNPKPILISNEPIMSPTWSPDGKKVAYVSFENKKAGIYISDVASGGRHSVTSFPGINGAPHFSPDGTKLALALSMNSANPNIYIMDLASHSLKQLTRDDAINTEPAWTPKGDGLLFTSNRGGGPQIYRVDVNQGNVSRVSYSGNYNATPSYTPDGQNIVVLHGQGGSNYDIGTIDSDSGSFSLLTNTGGGIFT